MSRQASFAEKLRLREIEKVLAAEMNSAHEEFRLATLRSAEVTADVPSGLPAPDSVSRITLAGMSRRLSFERLQVATQRWQDFVGKKIVPEDLADWDGVSPRSE